MHAWDAAQDWCTGADATNGGAIHWRCDRRLLRPEALRSLLASHPDGMVVGEIQDELNLAASTLSHHLDKLKNEGLINVKRESTFLRYTANTEALQELLGFLYAECCTRSRALKPQEIVTIRKQEKP